jgi:hypothetical protein
LISSGENILKTSMLTAAVCIGLLCSGNVARAVAPEPVLVDTVACNSSKRLCAGNDVYEVSLNCDYLETTSGGLSFYTSPISFSLFVKDDTGYLCNIKGSVDGYKTEMRCTEEREDTDEEVEQIIKPNQDNGVAEKQVFGGIKYIGENAPYCSP